MFLWFLSSGLSWLSPPRSLTKLVRFFSLYEDLRGIFIAPTQCQETWTFSLNNRWKGVFKSLVVACTHGSRAASHGCRSIFYVHYTLLCGLQKQLVIWTTTDRYFCLRCLYNCLWRRVSTVFSRHWEVCINIVTHCNSRHPVWWSDAFWDLVVALST